MKMQNPVSNWFFTHVLLQLITRYLLESKTIDNGYLCNSLDEYKAHNKPRWYELLYRDSHFQSAIQISMCLVVVEYGPRYKYYMSH